MAGDYGNKKGRKWSWFNGKLFLSVGGPLYWVHITVGPISFAIDRR